MTMNSVTISQYFKTNELKYDITYKFEKFNDVFHLKVETNEEGWYPTIHDYFFDTIESIQREFDEETKEGIMIVNFIKNNTKFKYSYRRFSTKEDMETLFNFLVSNTFKISMNKE